MTRRRLATRPVESTDTGSLVELLYDDGESEDVLFCAGHGGDVEPGTAELALELATGHCSATCWATLGHESDGSAFDSWHPPSTSIAPDDYSLLDRIADRGFRTVLSIHGLADDEVLVGGGIDKSVKTRVAEQLNEALSVPVAVANRQQYAGTHSENFVNWLAAGGAGLQLELGPTIRGPEADELERSLRELLDGELL